jgi:two-component system response regulator
MMPAQPIEILLVEDNPNDEELTLRALAKAKVSNAIHVVRDGVEALEYLFCEGAYSGRHMAESPRIVLLDLQLPKLNGMEVLQRMKSDPRTHNIPVVMLTSSRQQADVYESYKLGVNSYIVKPVNFEGFSAAISQLGLYWMVWNQPPKREGRGGASGGVHAAARIGAKPKSAVTRAGFSLAARSPLGFHGVASPPIHHEDPMKPTILHVLACAAALQLSTAIADEPKKAVATEDPPVSSQQNKMKTCNVEAAKKELKGDERKAFMSSCLRKS